MTQQPEHTFPIQFRDVHYIAALYRSNPFAINEKLKGTGLKPALYFLGSPLTAVGLIQYNESDLGTYNEVIIAIPVVPEHTGNKLRNWLDLYTPLKKRKVGQFIIHIPVTTQRSVDAGRNLWGYPKIVLPIVHDFSDNKIKSHIMNEEKKSVLLEFNGRSSFGIPIPSMDLMTYSFLEQAMLKTYVDVRANMKWIPDSDLIITVHDRTDEICKDVIALDICNKKPVFAIQATRFKADFFEGIKIH
ncbi:MAG: acetoacetate decarboxylase family protein [bacterium]|jgi:hypothetical protein